MKKHKWTAVFTACLVAFTAFISLDTFVFSSAYQTDATEMNLSVIQPAAQGQTKIETGTNEEAEDLTEDTAGSSDAAENASEKKAESSENTGDSSEKKAEPSENTGDSSEKKAESSENTGDSSEKKAGSSENSQDSADAASGATKSSDGGQAATESGSEGSDSESSESNSSKSGGSKSGKHRKKPGSGSGGGHGPGGSGGGGNSSSATTTTIRNFDEEEAAASVAEVTTDNTGSSKEYQDENIKITYTEYTTNDTTIHVADVQLTSAEYLKTAFANDTYGKNVTQSTSEIAAAHDAVLAINGDYYGVQERGYVIRNGVVYREEAGTNDVLCIYGDGTMKVVDPSTVTAQELVDQGVWQAFSFGPGLLVDGEIPISLDTEVGKAKASNPRTAIGMIDDLHYVFVVSDGRSDESEGLSLYELATFMQELGVKTAYNLDGGGSSTMVFQGEVINNPTSGFRDTEREVSDIVYIG